jgi:hypothetical protein
MVPGVSDDPNLSYFGHPILPAGFNADDVSGDEFDGAGTNHPLWPMLVELFEGLQIVLITDEMLAVFDGCADLTIDCDNWVVRIRAEPRTVTARKAA